MKKIALLIFTGFLSFMILACDNTSQETASNFTTSPTTATLSSTQSTSNTTGITTAQTTTVAATTTYVKDGDIMNYFRAVGVQGIYGDGSDYNDEITYDLQVEFTDGMSVLIRFVDLYESQIKIFDIEATKGGATMYIECYWEFRYSTSVTYTNGDQYLDGYLAFNGFDQTPIMSLATYPYDVTGTNTEDSMQSMLNDLVANLITYYETYIGDPIY